MTLQHLPLLRVTRRVDLCGNRPVRVFLLAFHEADGVLEVLIKRESPPLSLTTAFIPSPAPFQMAEAFCRVLCSDMACIGTRVIVLIRVRGPRYGVHHLAYCFRLIPVAGYDIVVLEEEESFELRSS